MKIVCWLNTIYMSIVKNPIGLFFYGAPTSGCDLVEQDNGDVVCNRCGKVAFNTKEL